MRDLSAHLGALTKRISESAGRWAYLYRAVDNRGRTVDFLLSQHRDIAAAKLFFTRAMERHGTPETITLGGYPATHSAVVELMKSGALPPQTKIRTSKYLNNLVEQDHRRVKQRVYPTLGFKSFRNAAVTISGVGLAQKIRKTQFDTPAVMGKEGMRVSHMWGVVLAG